MIRKFVNSLFLFIFIIGIPVLSQAEALKDNADDISSFEKRFKKIDESMNYLKNKNIDSNDIITLYTDTESLFRDVSYNTEMKDYEMAIKYLSDKITVLEEKSSERVLLAKRMDLVYILMVGLGLAVIAAMSIYSVYMYSRRK